MRPPAAFAHPVGGEIERGRLTAHAQFRAAFDPAEAAARDLRRGTVMGEAVLHLHGQRAAERVESEHGVGAFERHPLHRRIRDQVPIDRVAEGLVESDPVDIDRQPLSVARQGRRLEAAIHHVGLERVILGLVERNPGEAAFQRLQDAGITLAADIGAVDDARIGRDLVARHAAARDRCGGDDDFGRGGLGRDCRVRRRDCQTDESRNPDTPANAVGQSQPSNSG